MALPYRPVVSDKSTNSVKQSVPLLGRRSLLKGLTGLAGVSCASTLFSSPAISAAQELEVFSWRGYFSQEMIDEFKKDTGIQIYLTEYDSNDEALLMLKATKGLGFDLVFPSSTYLTNWHLARDLLRPIDETRLNLDSVHDSILSNAERMGTVYRGRRYAVPFAWGCEGIIYDSLLRDYQPGEISWNDQWSFINKGFVATRPESALISMALMIDGTGERLNDAYVNEDLCREVFGEALLFGKEHKSHVRQFWRDTDGLASAFTLNNCVVGQGWCGPAHALWKQTKSRFKFLAPKEGALAWMDTLAMLSGAPNVDQGYELINWLLSTKGAGMFMAASGFNSVVEGAQNELDLAAQERFNFSYNDDAAIDQLYWLKPEAAWFRDLRDIYVRKYIESA
ncbi:extracellular solute-binding protein [Kiloniella litopenaei]|uniref:extracellular solute-binding protein n=1 Tax=Kiloniella litopenaei TaxID=1549748 RepID=UPI003BAA3A87